MGRLISGWYRLLYSALRTPVLKWLFLPRFKALQLSVSPGHGWQESGEFFPASPAVVSRSQTLGEDLVVAEPETFPAVTWSLWSHASVTNNRFFGFLLHGDQFMIQPRRTPGPWRLSYRKNRVLWSSGDKVLVDRNRGHRMHVDRAIFLGGRDFTNWYHWLVDGLPQLHMANRLPEHLRDYPVIVPEQIFRYPTMLDALELFKGHRDMIVMPEWALLEADSLVWIDPLELSNLPKQQGPSPLDSRLHLLHRDGMESYRDVYLEAYAPQEVTPHRKLFLARDTKRRSYNQEEALEVAKEFGFEACYPEKLTLAEQVQVFREAKYLMGPSGAGFAGLLFCQPGTSALCWQDTRIRSMTILPDLATLNHAEYWHIFYTSDESGGLFRSNYTLDPQWLRQSLHTWLD
ncbi:glycosyltransferase [Pontimonas salivibrio]|uniref:Glycosyltransferase n=1 Tax=Pontimonas salivibrio TaxID=1159327 RepID=A0A2L2BS31_9MICO|nr:glycosyltransferase family 61 protein [Pontimonas salivibrio]AVG24483.1 glycosyltransferase [Pontimonas salivibrio]